MAKAKINHGCKPEFFHKPFSADHLRSILDYDEKTGLFTWKYRSDARKEVNTRMVGKVAGHLADSDNCRRIVVTYKNVKYILRSSRLVFLYTTGEWPTGEIDHINNNPADDRWVNLRLATRNQQLYNTRKRSDNTSGVKGVSWNKSHNRWRARIFKDKKEILLGYFKDLAQAQEAYQTAAKVRSLEFFNPG